MSIISRLLFTFFFVATTITANRVNLRDRVVAAVNCGGPEALGAFGIVYSADYSDDGTASDVGAQYGFNNAETDDVEIYQTERWSKDSFDYEVPVVADGEYVIILKFSEVYFREAGQKVFNVKINSRTVIKNLDIFDASGGRGFAHDVYIQVSINGKKITVNGQSKEYKGKLVIEFAKGSHDNPKVNGFAVLRGTADDLPPPPEKHVPDEHFPEDYTDEPQGHDPSEDSFNPQIIRGDEMEDEMFSATTGSENPFEKESVDYVLPIVAALIVIIPVAYVIQMRFAQPQ